MGLDRASRTGRGRLIASTAVSGDGSPSRGIGPGRLSGASVVVVGVVVATAAMVGLGVQAVSGARTVTAQRSAGSARDAALDDAFYRCIDVQTASLVSPGQPVVVANSNLADFITLVKGAGSWLTIAEPPSRASGELSLRNNVAGPGTCRGTVVVERYAVPHHGVRVGVGSGASVPGHGPPPATPL